MSNRLKFVSLRAEIVTKYPYINFESRSDFVKSSNAFKKYFLRAIYYIIIETLLTSTETIHIMEF